MLPLELLNVIFGALSRDDLDALMLTNVLFRDIVLRDFAEEPLRYFHRIHIRGQQNYVFELTEGKEEPCEDNGDFSRRMRLARVGRLHFSDTHFDEDIFQVLLPFKDAWRDGRLITQRCTASASVLERAFSELFFCTDIFVDVDLHGEISQPFLSLPAVRECALLSLIRLPIQLTSDEIFEWVYADARSKKPKLLELGEEQLVDSAMDFVGQLMTDFNESKTTCRYAVTVWTVGYDGQPWRLVNNDTSEVLDVSVPRFYDEDLGRWVDVERMPMDDQ